MATKKMDRVALLQRYEEYMGRWKNNGKPTIVFAPPCGCSHIERTAPPRGQVWTSLFTCPHCESVFYTEIRSTHVLCGEVITCG